MKKLLMTTPMMLLVSIGAALAQSGQGGYLGENPGKKSPVSSTTATPPKTSEQGGYLGENPGKNQPAASTATPPVKGSGEGGYLGMPPGSPGK
jgi:hypothetical protein